MSDYRVTVTRRTYDRMLNVGVVSAITYPDGTVSFAATDEAIRCLRALDPGSGTAGDPEVAATLRAIDEARL